MKRETSHRPTPTVAGSSGAKRRRQALDEEIRLAFSGYLDSCRRKIEMDNIKSEMDEDLKRVARLLERKAKRETTQEKNDGK